MAMTIHIRSFYIFCDSQFINLECTESHLAYCEAVGSRTICNGGFSSFPQI